MYPFLAPFGDDPNTLSKLLTLVGSAEAVIICADTPTPSNVIPSADPVNDTSCVNIELVKPFPVDAPSAVL